MNKTAKFQNAQLVPSYFPDEKGRLILKGNIYEDSFGRFEDGTFVTSSFVVTRIDRNNFVTHTGTHYTVVSWADGEPENL